MKKLIMTTVIATCLALCAAVWPQSEAVEENTRTDSNPRRERTRSDRCRTQNGSRNHTTDRERKSRSPAIGTAP